MTVRLIHADVLAGLAQLPDASVHACVTSPPYWQLRDYGFPGQIGLEATPEIHIDVLVGVFREVRRVLRDDGCLMLNYGDMWAAGGHLGRKDTDPEQIARRRALYGTGIGPGSRVGKGSPKPFPAGLKPKDLVLMPERLALALQADGWWVRDRIIWHKPNPMPSSVKDRCTPAHEIVWQLAKSEWYYWDAEGIAEARTSDEDAAVFPGGVGVNGARVRQRQSIGNRRVGRASQTNPAAVPPGTALHTGLAGKNEAVSDRRRSGFNGRWVEAVANGAAPLTRNCRNVWTIASEPFPDAHFATFPTELVRRCILATCPAGGTVLDPFGGSGTVGMVADRLQRDSILIEANPEYVAMAEKRITLDAPLFTAIKRTTHA